MTETVFCNFGRKYGKKRLLNSGCSNKAHFELSQYNLRKGMPIRTCTFHLARTLNERIIWNRSNTVIIKRIKIEGDRR